MNITEMAGQVLRRLPDGTVFIGFRYDESGWRWTIGDQPRLAQGDVVEVPVKDKTYPRRVKTVRLDRGDGQLVRQHVEFSMARTPGEQPRATNPTLDNYHAEPYPHLGADHRAPGGLVLVGTVHGHQTHKDEEVIMTASVLWHGATGRSVPTVSGTVYELLDPDPTWLAWMGDEGIPFDEDNPLRLISKAEIAARHLGDQ